MKKNKIENLVGEVYETKDLIEVLGVSERTVLKYLGTGELIGRQVGGRWMVTKINLMKFLNAE